MQLKKYLLFLPVLTAIVFHLPVLFSCFAWDDVTLVGTNTGLASTPIHAFFGQDYGMHLGSRQPVGYYRPLFVSVLSLIYRTSGPSPIVFHSMSLLLMCAASVLLVLVCRRMLDGTSQLLPVLAGCLYAAHPARSEVVSLVMSMPDLAVETCCLAVVFILTAPGRARPVLSAAGVFLVSLAAVTFKESAFFLLGGIAAGAVLHSALNRPRIGKAVLLPAAVVAAIAAGILLNSAAGIARPALHDYLRLLVTSGAASAIKITLAAARDILIPRPPVFMSSVEAAPSLTASAALVICLCLAAAAVFRLSRASLRVSLLFCWFAAGLFSLMLIGAVGIPYSARYIPLAPAILGLALLFQSLQRAIKHRVFLPAAIACIAAHGLCALSGAMVCRNNLTLFSHIAEQEPTLAYPRVFLADRLFFEYRDYVLMEVYAREAIGLAPSSPENARLWKLLARKKIMEGSFAEAMDMLGSAAQILQDSDAELLWLQAICELNSQRHDAALRLLERAVQLEPGNAEYRDLLQQVLDRNPQDP